MKKSGAELGQQAQATAAAAGALAGAAAARGALRGMRQSPGGRSARGGPLQQYAPSGVVHLAFKQQTRTEHSDAVIINIFWSPPILSP